MGYFFKTVLLPFALLSVIFAQAPFLPIPEISHEVEKEADAAGISGFLNIWKFAHTVNDPVDKSPAVRVSLEPKTILAPSTAAIVHLVPQDGRHPLYLTDEKHTALRREFVLDHLVLNSVDPEQLKAEEETEAINFNGKTIFIQKDQLGNIKVNGVPASYSANLTDGTQIYVLKQPLFNSDTRVRSAFEELHGTVHLENEDLGPPLTIPGPEVPFPPVRAPASPPEGVVGPPGSPIVARSPAPPHFGFRADPPAPPFHFRAEAPAPPPIGSRFLVPVGPPAPPPEKNSSDINFTNDTISHSGKSSRLGKFLHKNWFSNTTKSVTDNNTILFYKSKETPGQTEVIMPNSVTFHTNVKSPPNSILTYVSNDEKIPTSKNQSLHSFLQESPNESTIHSESSEPIEILDALDEFATLFSLSGNSEVTIVKALQEERLLTFLASLEKFQLLTRITNGDEGPFIVLVPTEESFHRLSEHQLQSLASHVIAYHIIPFNGISIPEVTDGLSLRSLDGKSLYFSLVGERIYVNSATIISNGVEFNEGIIYTIDSILDPPSGTLTETLQLEGEEFSRIARLLETASFEGTVTFFAPLDSALVSKGYGWPWPPSQEVISLVHEHMIPGTWYIESLLAYREVPTFANTTIVFRKSLGGLITANGIPLIQVNLTALNGVLHIAADVLPSLDLGIYQDKFQRNDDIFTDSVQGREDLSNIVIPSGLYETPFEDPINFDSLLLPPLPTSGFLGVQGIPFADSFDNFWEPPDISHPFDLFSQNFPGGISTLSNGSNFLTSFPSLNTTDVNIYPFLISDNNAIDNLKLKDQFGTTFAPVADVRLQQDYNPHYAYTREDSCLFIDHEWIEDLSSFPNTSKFIQGLYETGLHQSLDLNGEWTILAPDDSTFNLETKNLSSIEKRRLLAYHVVLGAYSPHQFIRTRHYPSLDAGYLITVHATCDENRKKILFNDVPAYSMAFWKGGAIYALNKQLNPPEGDLLTNIKESPSLTIFASLIKQNPTLTSILSEWLMSHVAEGVWYSEVLKSVRKISSVVDSTIETFSKEDSLLVNNKTILQPDVTCTNGVLHYIQPSVTFINDSCYSFLL